MLRNGDKKQPKQDPRQLPKQQDMPSGNQQTQADQKLDNTIMRLVNGAQ